MFTFAVEQLCFAADPDFSQKLSITIHAVNSLIVFWLILLISRVYAWKHCVGWALLGSLIWACAPQKVSTVLYIVQRMTMLAASFSLLALCCYLIFRTTHSKVIRYLTAIALAVFTLCAPFAKENGVLVVPLMACIELYVLPSKQESRCDTVWTLSARVLLICGIAFFIAFGIYQYLGAEHSFSGRAFSFYDRVLTSPQVLVDYMLQLFFPSPATMGLMYDDYPMASWMVRPTELLINHLTLLATISYLGWATLHKERNAVAFGLSFFLVGHSIESFYLPLEVFFEHRNYLPSLGLILALLGLVHRLCERMGGSLYRLVACVGVAYSTVLIISTASLAAWWSSPESLLQHHILGHPTSARANADLAVMQAQSGDYEAALSSIDLAFELSRSQPAARSMGEVDPLLLRFAVRCMVGKDQLVEARAGVETGEANPIRTVSIRLLTSLYRDEVCPSADWPLVSDHLFSLVLELERAENRPGIGALIDLALFEQARESALRTYAYGAMVVEREAEQATALLLMADAAFKVGDIEQTRQLVDRLTELDNKGLFSPMNQTLFGLLTDRDVSGVH